MKNGRINYGLALGPKYRFNDKFSLILRIRLYHKKNDRDGLALTIRELFLQNAIEKFYKMILPENMP